MKILGYDWADIQRAQQGGKLSTRVVDTSKPAASGPTDEDRAMLEQHGSIAAIELAGLYGVADRLRRSS